MGERDKTTPLQERLEDLAGKIGKGGTYAAVLTFLALIISGLLRDELAELGFNAETARVRARPPSPSPSRSSWWPCPRACPWR